MRKIKFPFELDATEIMSDEAKEKVRPVNAKLKEIEKARDERIKVAKRTKKDSKEEGIEHFLKSEEEVKKRAEEKAELETLVDASLKEDEGACVSGLYDLIGVVAHKGASADGGKLYLSTDSMSMLSFTLGHYLGYAPCEGKENAWFSKPHLSSHVTFANRRLQNLTMPRSRLSTTTAC